MADYKILPKQSLFDIAIEVYGDVQGVVWLIQDNQLLGPTDPLTPGAKLTVRPAAINARAVVYLADFAPFNTITEADVPQGIGFWKTEEYLIG